MIGHDEAILHVDGAMESHEVGDVSEQEQVDRLS